MIGVLLGLGPVGVAAGAFLLQWSIQSGGSCFPDDDGVFVSFALSVLLFAVASGLLVPLTKGRRLGVLIGWTIGLIPFVVLAIHITNYLNGLGSGCPDGPVPPPW